MTPVAFRFDAGPHAYIAVDTGETLQHITGMLEKTGWVDDLWFTEESRDRGTAVHQLTADYDLGALDVQTCVTPYRGYLLSHVAAMGILRPEILAVEEPIVHPVYRFGGRPDRVERIYQAVAVLEGKSGAKTKAHGVQTALQAMLVAVRTGLPVEAIARYCLYWQGNGRFKLEEHKDRRDLTEARRVVRVCCGC
jgi:hypothetical protein